MNKVLYLMMGVPGSGKSTFIQNHLLDKEVWVSRDQIRFSLLSEDDDYFSKEDKVLKLFISTIDKMLSPKSPYAAVYADATHLTKKGRRQLLSQLKNKPIFVNALFINTPLSVCLKRNAQREGRAKVPAQTIRSMYSRIQKPTKEEGIHMLTIFDENGEIISKEVL